jgi:hypothetical protein
MDNIDSMFVCVAGVHRGGVASARAEQDAKRRLGLADQDVGLRLELN